MLVYPPRTEEDEESAVSDEVVLNIRGYLVNAKLPPILRVSEYVVTKAIINNILIIPQIGTYTTAAFRAIHTAERTQYGNL